MVLEGGYDLDAVAASAAIVVRSLLGCADEPQPGMEPGTPLAAALVGRYRRALVPCWPGLEA